MRDWWVTVLEEHNRSRDVRVTARSEWSAGWLLRTLQPGAVVLHIRPVCGAGAP